MAATPSFTWKYLTGFGSELAHYPSEKRAVFLSNAISLIIACVGLILFAIYYLWYGWSIITVCIPVISILSLIPIMLNASGATNASRVWLCIFLPTAVMCLSILGKMTYYHRPEELDYYTFRIIILSTCIFPAIFFSLREKALLIGSSAFILVSLIMHDPLHAAFGVSYKATSGIIESNYRFTNVIIFFAYLVMTGAVVFMKWVSETNEDTARKLITELNNTNVQLQEKNRETEEKNQEILNQTEILNLNRKKLADAYQLIEDQRNLLFLQNKNLSSELLEKNKILTETNNELIKHNNELRQFSFTVSHNLRGPVASLKGLLKLFEQEELSAANREVFNFIHQSTESLDGIIRDLGKIIDIRNDIFHVREQVDLMQETNEVLKVFAREIRSFGITVHTDFNGTGIIYCVRPMVHSILYNLIGNAIKYKSADREAIIFVSTRSDEQFYYLTVEDNGLGIDLPRDSENLFKLYKRFHYHTEGKGLGLYLVKLQAEALGGSISVESELNNFTRFTVKLRKPQNAERQILYREPVAEIFYDARLNCIGTQWLKPVSDQEYRDVLKKLIDFIRVYHTPNYLSSVFPEDSLHVKERFINFIKVIPEASANGLKRIGLTYTTKPLPDTVDQIKESLLSMGVEINFFPTLEDGFRWIDSEPVPQVITS